MNASMLSVVVATLFFAVAMGPGVGAKVPGPAIPLRTYIRGPILTP